MQDTDKTKNQLIAELVDLRGGMEDMRQQREVEKAAGRIRERVLSMHSSDDLLNIVGILFEEMLQLKLPVRISNISFVNEVTQSLRTFVAVDHPKKYGISWTSSNVVEISDNAIALVWPSLHFSELFTSIEQWRQGEVFSYEMTSEHRQFNTQIFRERYGFDCPSMPHFEAAHFTTIPFTLGWVSIVGDPLSDKQIDVVQTFTQVLSLGYIRFLDFHKLEGQNQALKEANQQIQEANRLKSDFLARMSHDLRTPMNAIIGYTRILLRQAKEILSERQYRNLDNIQISANNLLSLINDILDLSKIEAGRIDIKPEAVDLKQLATECIISVESLVQPGVQLEQQLADVSPVHTDADRIRRVVMNLLSNALKFTEQGSITVSAKPVEGWMELSVADTGSGIPPEDLPHIFDEFRQVEGQEGTQQEGTGLGLSIAKKSMELLGGTISVESEMGKGTKFTLRITDYEEKEVE